MEVILREDVMNLGHTGDIVKVKPGYARNYLLPRGLAVVADGRNISALEHAKRVAQLKREKERVAASSLATRLAALTLTFQARAGEEGKLFGSITNQDIERSLGAAGFAVERRRIRIDEPIKSLGQHTVSVHLAAGVDARISVVVESEGGPAPEAAE